MINRHSSNPSNELEVVKMLFIAQSRERIYLQRVVVPVVNTIQSEYNVVR